MRTLISALLIALMAGSSAALTTASPPSDGGVTIRSNTSTGVVLDPGDAVSFQYQSARDAAVLVFDIDTQGNVSLLTDEPVSVRAHTIRNLPDDGSQLVAEGRPGVEFIFALAVDDPGAIDRGALASLRDGSRQITGDPFVAANMLTAEVVRNVAQQTVFIGYTYFYVSDRVDYPCYLCGSCDGSSANECAGYRIAQNFDRGTSLAYPLARGYEMESAAAEPATEDTSGESVAMPTQQDDVNFYPYGSEIHYADPMAVNLWYNWGWYDPAFWYYPYSYPYCGYPWSFSVGVGWGWGWGWGWGGYYCGGWYNPYCGGGYYGGYPCYPYGGAYSGNVAKFKSQYKSNSNYAPGTLAQNRSYAMKRDGALQVASKQTRTWNTPVSYRTRTSITGRSTYASHRVKTSVSGVAGTAWADGRRKGFSGTTPYRLRDSGRSSQDRGIYSRAKSGVYSNGATRAKSQYSARPETYRWNPYNYGSKGSGNASPMMRGYSGSRGTSPVYRGGHGGGWSGGWSGGRGYGGGGGHGKGR